MSFFILSTPLGVIVGYILTAVVISEATWQWAFYVMSVNMLLLTCAMICFNKNYINYDLMLKEYSHIKRQRARAAAYSGINLETAENSAINQDQPSLSDDDLNFEEEPKKGTCATLWHLKGNLVYMTSICGLTCLYFIITNIQYWVTLYLINNIGATES